MNLSTKKKLLVLDVNGLLVERFFHADKRPEHRSPDGKIGKFYVYKRPYCTEFLTFCFEKFEVGLWSSAQQHNVQNLVDFVFGDLKSKLVFIWHQSDCTDTGLRTLDNKMKPLFLKELYKLWSKLKPDLPWEEGDYGPFNTLLIDDTPYKAMCNPPHTAIFPYPYEVSSDPDDALGGALRKYLEGIADATNVQDYVKYHPFGQLPISKESPQWDFYCNILSLPTVNCNSSSNVESNVKGVADKTSPSIACNNGSSQSSSSQQCSVPSIEREGDGLAETVVRCIAERNGAPVTSFTQKHTILNCLEENGFSKVTQPGKKKRKSAMQDAINHEHEVHHISPVDKAAAFGIQQSDLDVVSTDDGWSETAVTYMAERNGDIATTLSQNHVTFNGLQENGVAKATNPRKKRRNSVMEAAFNQEHEVRNRSSMDEEATFVIPRQSDLDEGFGIRRQSILDDAFGIPAKATNPRKNRRNSVIEAALNQDHEVHNRSFMDKEAAFGIPRQSDELFGIRRRYDLDDRFGIPRQSDIDVAFSIPVEATNPRKKRRTSVMEAALNQEHEVHNRSSMDKEITFGITRQSDFDVVSKDDGWSETAMTCMAERNGAIATPTNAKHATSGNKKVDSQTDKYYAGNNTLKRSGKEVDSQTDKYYVGNNNLKRSGRDVRDAGCSNRGHHYRAIHFNKDNRDYSNHRPSHNFHINNGGDRTYHVPRNFEGNWRHQNDVNATLPTQVAHAGTCAQTNTGGSRTSHFPRNIERNWRHQTDANSTIQTQVAHAGSHAQTKTGDNRTSHFPRKWRHQTDANSTIQTQVAQAGIHAQIKTGGSRTSHFRRKWGHQTDANSTIQTQVAQVGTHAQTNTGGSQTSHFPRKFERNWSHQNDVNATFQTQVANTGMYAQTNAGGNRTSHNPSNFEGNSRHQNDVNSTLQAQVTKTGTYAETNTVGSRTSHWHYTRRFEENLRHQNDINATLQTQVARTGTHDAQTNTGVSRTSHYPRMSEGNLRHQNDVNATLRTQVAQVGTNDNNNAFGGSAVPENLVGYEEGYTNGGHYQSFAKQHSHLRGSSYGARYQNHNHVHNPRLFSHSYPKDYHMKRESNDRKTHRSNNRF